MEKVELWHFPGLGTEKQSSFLKPLLTVFYVIGDKLRNYLPEEDAAADVEPV